MGLNSKEKSPLLYGRVRGWYGELPYDTLNDLFSLIKHITIAESNHLNALTYEELGSVTIVLLNYRIIMMDSIQFNCQTVRRAIKIKNKFTYTVLPPNFFPIHLLSLQVIP